MQTADQTEVNTTDVASNAVIRVEDVHKYYELGETRVHALRGVSVEIRRGEFVAIMGASGSGKSTFMNMLGCLDRPSSGRYLLEGIDVSKHGKRALAQIRNQKIGFVFQRYNLLATATAGENVEIPSVYAGLAKHKRSERATSLLQRLGLGGVVSFVDAVSARSRATSAQTDRPARCRRGRGVFPLLESRADHQSGDREVRQRGDAGEGHR